MKKNDISLVDVKKLMAFFVNTILIFSVLAAGASALTYGENDEITSDTGDGEFELNSENGEIYDWDDLNDIRDDLSGDYVLMNDLDENTEGYDDHVSETAITEANERFGSLHGNAAGTQFDVYHTPIEEVVKVIDTNDDSEVAFDVISYEDGTVELNEATEGFTWIIYTTAGPGWNPIGIARHGLFYGIPFTGTFDGQGHQIKDLFINRPTERYTGLFGGAGNPYESAVIKNIGLEDVNVTGEGIVGGLSGNFQHSEGFVENSYVTGEVNANHLRSGGLIGNLHLARVRDSYTMVNVTSTDNAVGGLVGYMNSASVNNSYSTGEVSGGSRVGGLVGEVSDSTVSNSYWDVESTGQDESDGGTGLTTEEMIGEAAEENMDGFDFTDTWETLELGEEIDHDIVPEEDGYPILQPDDEWLFEKQKYWITAQLDAQDTGYEIPLIFQIETTEVDETFSFYAEDADLEIEWGDGNTDETTGDGYIEHEYAEEGTYNIILKGTATRISYAGKNYGDYQGTPELLTDILTPMPTEFGLESTYAMFVDIEVSEFRTEDFLDDASTNITDMRYMFYNSDFDQDIGGWDVSNVTDMENMFEGGSLSQGNYDALLLGWSELSLEENVKFHAGDDTPYSPGGPAEARQNIIDNYSWIITDGDMDYVTDIEVIEDPDKMVYTRGEELDLTGLNVKVTWEFAGEETLTWPEDESDIGTDIDNATILKVDDHDGVAIEVWHEDDESESDTTSALNVYPGFTFQIETTTEVDTFRFYAEDADLDIDWGDGNTGEATGDGYIEHGYAEGGTYNITLNGTAYRISYAGEDHVGWSNDGTPDLLKDILSPMPAEFGLESAYAMFVDTEVQSFSVENFFDNASANIEDMSYMFFYSSFDQDINDWDVSNVRDTSYMFYSSSFDQDINDWDVSSVEDMSSMFETSNFNQDIGDWDVGNVTDMERMFSSSDFDQDIGGWDVSSVTDMSQMFHDAESFDQDIGGWDVGNVTDMSQMFQSSNFDQDIGDWDVSSVRDTSQMFQRSNFDQDIGDWDVSSVEDMSSMFQISNFDQDIGDWDVGNVTDMSGMFIGGFVDNNPFDRDIGGWDVSSVTDMSAMFRRSNFDQDIGGWDVSNVTDMSGMFEDGSLSQGNYDALLLGWSELSLEENVKFHAGDDTPYSPGGPAEARQNIIDNYSWTIKDGDMDYVTDIDIIDNPDKMEYTHGEELDLTGLNVKVTWEFAGEETLTWPEDESDIGTDIDNATILKVDDHDGVAIEVWHEDDESESDTTSALTVEPGELDHIVAEEITFDADTGEGELNVTAYDQHGNTIEGVTIEADEQDGLDEVEPGSDETDADGNVTFTISETEAGTYEPVFKVQGEEISYTATVTVEPGEVVSIEAEDATFTADEEGELNVTAYDQHDNSVDGVTIEVDDQAGLTEITPASDVTDADGNVTFTISETEAGTYEPVFKVQGEEISYTATVTVELGELDHIVAEEIMFDADTGEGELNVTAYDQHGNPVDGVTIEVDDQAGLTEITPASDVTDADGNVTFTVTETEAGTYEPVFKVQGEDISYTATVTVEPGEVVSIEAEDATFTADEEGELNVTAYDQHDNPVDGVTIEVDDLAGLTEITPASDETDADGNVTFTVTETEAGTYELVFKVQGEDISYTATVTVEPGEVVSIEAEDATFTADEEGELNVTAYDQHDNSVDGVTIEVDYQAGLTEITPASDVTDADGNVTFTVTETEAGTYEPVFGVEGEDITDTAIVTVLTGEVASIEAEDVTFDADKGQGDVIVMAYDQQGNVVEDVTIEVDDQDGLTDITPESDETDTDGEVTFTVTETEAGTYELVFKVDGEDISDSAEVTVGSAEVDSVVIEPVEDQNITAGDTIEFNASAYDQYGNLITDDASDFTWEYADNGVFDTTEPGEYYVTATYDGEPSEITKVTVLEEYDLTITIQGQGTTDPEEGDHIYNHGENVTLEATPDEGWKFIDWTGDVSAKETTINITMDENKSITANFEELVAEFEVTNFNIEVDGFEVTITADVENVGDAEGSFDLVIDGEWIDTITLGAGTADEYEFTHEFDEHGDYEINFSDVLKTVNLEEDEGLNMTMIAGIILIVVVILAIIGYMMMGGEGQSSEMEGEEEEITMEEEYSEEELQEELFEDKEDTEEDLFEEEI